MGIMRVGRRNVYSDNVERDFLNYQIAEFYSAMNGVLIIDKPAGMTSHDVVNRVRRILGERSVGHLGTLDPMATGVLPLVVGNWTRLAQFYLKSEKTYEGGIRFGFSTDTYDAEGQASSSRSEIRPTLAEVRECALRFVGNIEQTPPPFSAKKIDGVPAYKKARKKQEVVLQPVQVEVQEFEIVALEDDCAFFRAHVASGTYIRSIAHDMGEMLGCGAHLASLRRTCVKEFTLAEAHSLDEVQGCGEGRWGEDMFIHPRKLLPEMPSISVTEEAVSHIRCGRTVNLPELSRAKRVKVFRGQKDLICIATRVAGTLFHPGIVFLQEEEMLARTSG
jgi:tRNA pseudouridine55 synthase